MNAQKIVKASSKIYILKNRNMKFILLALMTITSLTSNAQNLLIPSKKSFEKKWIRNTTYQMVWYTIRDTTEYEIAKVNTQIVKDKSKLTVVTRVVMKNMKTDWVDSTVANLKTLKPIRHSSYNMQRDIVLNFGEVVTGFYNDKTKKTISSVSDTTRNEYFDSNLYPILIGWLPLRNNYKQDISIYNYNPAGKTGMLKAYLKNVTSSSYQTEKNGIRNVWVVTVSDEIGNGVVTYYFDRVDRKLWKYEIDVNGSKMIIKLIE
ncbi:hypothetical protein [Sphingobacterium detergens]|uniref:Uncharacterized protein n=1 Tax=Sphingobacterium detergens TaxID=1145106 RepID=A0A420BGY9_SPHD1|nr:hypothetical protein [Sphingobacterium detergens]RKE56001.1 hypothetical protein DFQ12_0853 [Sphingobacterium detergens]